MTDERIIAAVLAVLVLVITYWGTKIMSKISDFAATLLASVAAQTTVTASFVAFSQGQAAAIDDLHSQLRAALDKGDTDVAADVLSQLESAQAQLKANTAGLASAMAANTDAAGEVHKDLPGGIGSTDTVVDATAVTLEPPTEPPVPAVEVEESGGITGDGSGSGTSEGGELDGGTQTGTDTAGSGREAARQGEGQ